MKNGISLKLGSLMLIAKSILIAFLKSFMKLVPYIIKLCIFYPPQSSFVLPNNTGITFSTFQKFIEEDIASISSAEINKLNTQNNYLRLYVKVLGEHISSPNTKLDDLTILTKDIKAYMAKTTSAIATNVASTSKSKPLIDSTYIQRPLEISDFKPNSFKIL
ncbi:hypothetical protein H5410_031271 [Solanum commersonii]|uniref:Uncharacterized protein n=1 Tax=Solanum commersonii TaxID=4109 RepID=A0A9J5YIN7_SOLCO|nr:hypothetical protein H5410_031271 [Solanum commersonii]